MPQLSNVNPNEVNILFSDMTCLIFMFYDNLGQICSVMTWVARRSTHILSEAKLYKLIPLTSLKHSFTNI